MNILSFCRNKVFWTMDAVRGHSVKSAYNRIRKIDEMDSSNTFIKEHQKKAWKKLKEIAITNTEHYRNIGDSKFLTFPVITKNDIRNDLDAFLSNRMQKDRMIQMITSGSTGIPFVSYQNFEKKKTVNAEIIYYSGKVGYRLGDNLSYIRTIVKQNQKSKLKQFVQNQTLINCMSIDDKGIHAIFEKLQSISKKEKTTLMAYGSTYAAMKDYIKKHNIESLSQCNICGAISGSDMLFDETRMVISGIFGNIPVVSRYSNEENGVIGQDEGINNVFVINEANYIVEICDETGKQLPEGELGHIVVTDLYNYAMPMIRYDTGDMGAIKIFDINGRKKKCICQFSGRKVDVIYNTKGNVMSPHVITNYMWNYTDIRQFQIIQVNKKQYKLRLNVSNDFSRMQELVNMLRSLRGLDANICVEKVNEIPVLASGKRRYIINEWKS